MVCGWWSVVGGMWSVVYGLWSVACGVLLSGWCSVVGGLRSVVCSLWSLVGGVSDIIGVSRQHFVPAMFRQVVLATFWWRSRGHRNTARTPPDQVTGMSLEQLFLGLPTTDHQPQATYQRPPTIDHRPQTTDHRPQTTNHQPQSTYEHQP